MHKTAPNCAWTAFNSCTMTCKSLTTRQGYSDASLLIVHVHVCFLSQEVLTKREGWNMILRRSFDLKKSLLVPLPSESDLRSNFRRQMIKTFLVNDYLDELQHATTAFNWMLAEKKRFLSTTLKCQPSPV